MPPIVDPLLAILDDPAQAEKHADAIRALKLTSFYLHARRARYLRRRVISRLHQVLCEGSEQLIGPTLSALESIAGSSTSWVHSVKPALEEGKVSAERKQLLQNEAALEKLVLEEKQQEEPPRSEGRF
jgi:hypothetical protein